MDEIQKVLIKAGRKDLAQKYYKKIARDRMVELALREIKPKMRELWRELLQKYKSLDKELKSEIFYDLIEFSRTELENIQYIISK